MATLETQYKNFKINNPTSTFTFEEWKEDFGKKLEKGIKKLKMNKEFVTYEQALALEEFGFDEHCFGFWAKINGEWVLIETPCEIVTTNACKAPLKQQAFRWFREKHNLVFNFISYSIVKPGEYHWSITWNDEAKATGAVKTYEEAEQACLNKLIEMVKSNLVSKNT